MVLQFTKDPQTGVVVPPVTVFNGGKRKSKKTRKSKKASRKGRKQTRRR
jgi:hypothetical protein